MAQEREQRRLAAILAADIVGYSRLMVGDESGTLARLKILRAEVFDPVTAQFGGRIFKTTGDGALAEFGSAADAVQCSVEIQRALALRNKDVPTNVRMDLRIGISLGDVLVDGDDLFGNGVNIAARLEGIAEPGGICVSGNVYEHVGATPDLLIEDMGDQQVKNIERPIRCYRVVVGEGSNGRRSTPETTEPLKKPDRASIVILPFQNMSGDPGEDYFSDGMTEDLITDLSKVSGLFVIARNSSFSYKNRAMDVRKVGQELGVHHALEGSVRRAGKRVRINAQLIDAVTGGHVWAERYDGDMDDIFALQDEITAKIVAALELNLTAGSGLNALGHVTDSVEAYELFLQARAAFYLFTPEQFAHCIRLYERAIEIDPVFAAAWSGQVFPYQSGWSFLWDGYDDALNVAIDVGRKGLALDNGDSFTNWRLGWALGFSGKSDEAIAHFERAIEINPRDAEAYAYFAEVLNFAGDPARGLQMTQTSQQFDPVVPPNCAFHAGHSYFLLGQLEEAQRQIQRAIDLAPGFPVARMIMAATLIELGKKDSAKAQIDALLSMHPQHRISVVDERYPYVDNTQRDRVLKDLREAGLPD